MNGKFPLLEGGGIVSPSFSFPTGPKNLLRKAGKLSDLEQEELAQEGEGFLVLLRGVELDLFHR